MSTTAMRRLVVAACLLLCVALPNAASANATESGIVHAMNRYRAQFGLPALHTSSGLHRAAAAHSRSMLRRNVLSHGAFSARVHRYVHVRSVGENLAWMQTGCDAQTIVNLWINSPEHREIMLTRGFRRVGVGRRANSSGCFVTADFGSAR
jgi:uncharacterized protein YkwD